MSLEPVDAKSRYITLVLGDAGRRGFDRVLLDTGASRTQFVPVHHRQDPGPAGPGPGAVPAPVVFGAREAEGGVKVYYIDENGPWPFQYYRRAEFGYDTNDEMHAQLAATPWLDTKAFGTRPGAAPGADYALQPGQKIIVLDQTRLDYLEQQRALLGKIDRTPGNRVGVETRDDQVTQLSDLIFEEIDYATMGQAVPDFDTVIENIRVRAPDDPLFQRAISAAETRLGAKWKSEGRTPDQLGQVVAAGEAGNFDQVRTLTKDQFVAMIDALGPDATPAQIQAEILRRAGIYTTYLTGDDRYPAAILAGIDDANKEIMVNRPVKTVLDIARAGGEDWANDAVAKLHELLTTKGYTPDQVIAIMSDPQIQKLIRQGLRHADSFDAPEQGTLPALEDQSDTDLVKDISAIYSLVLYADGKPGTGPGKGRQLVDQMAQFIVDNTMQKQPVNSAIGMTYNHVFQDSATEGHVALALAVGAKARGIENSAFNDLNRPEHAVALGIRDFREKYDTLKEQIGADSAFLQVPLQSVGGESLSPEKRLKIIDGLIKAFPEEARKLNGDLEQLNQLLESRESVQFALDTYAPAFGDSNNIKFAREELDRIPPADPATPASSPGEAAGIAPTNSLWFLRANRLATDFLVKSYIPSVGNTAAFQRGSKGVSAFLFAANANSLVGGPIEDLLFIPVHSMMAGAHATKALLGEDWSKRLFGQTPGGEAATKFTQLADDLEVHVNNLNVSAATKRTLLTLGRGAILDPLDIAYIGVDGYNSVAYFTGNTAAGETDLVRGFAYATSVASDASLVIGTGLAFAGGGATLLGLSATAWTGIGIGLMLVASGLNYFKGLHDNAHAFDGFNAKAWELAGIKDPQVAKYLGMGATLADGDSHKNAGPFLVAMFAHAGYTPEEMVAHINANWTPEQADKLATYIKRAVTRRDDGSFTEEDFASIETYAENVGIKVPDYYNESNSPFKPDPNAPPAWEWVGP
jgi:hypothetical protein